MLQQLRSSGAAIAARRESAQLRRVVDDLGSKLEIIGEAVLWPTAAAAPPSSTPTKVYIDRNGAPGALGVRARVLRRGRRRRACLHRSGMCRRAILAIGCGDPASSAAGDYVVVHGGREWTAEQLRSDHQRPSTAAEHDRSAVPADRGPPVVAARSAATPATSSATCVTCCPRWREANRRMTAEAIELEDGAEFAARAPRSTSAVEGGRDWRGLQLRPAGHPRPRRRRARVGGPLGSTTTSTG